MTDKKLANKYIKMEYTGCENGIDEYNIILKVANQEFYISNNCNWTMEEALFMKDMLGIALYKIVRDNKNMGEYSDN